MKKFIYIVYPIIIYWQKKVNNSINFIMLYMVH